MFDRDYVISECKWAAKQPQLSVVPSREFFESVVKLLEEQEAMPITYTDNPYTRLPVAHCPKCGKFARQFHSVTTEETHFCPWCGQAVKWDG